MNLDYLNQLDMYLFNLKYVPPNCYIAIAGLFAGSFCSFSCFYKLAKKIESSELERELEKGAMENLGVFAANKDK